MYFISSIERCLLDEVWPGNYQPSPLFRYLGPLLGVKATLTTPFSTSVIDPKRTSVIDLTLFCDENQMRENCRPVGGSMLGAECRVSEIVTDLARRRSILLS